LRKAWRAGFKDADWARRDPELDLLHGESEFDELYPESSRLVWHGFDDPAHSCSIEQPRRSDRTGSVRASRLDHLAYRRSQATRRSARP
jgi:hypothetical protein